MALTKIKSHSVAVNSLTVANIADNAIDATKIASNSILTRHIDDAQITTDQILDGTIATADIADDAVTSAKLDTNIDIAGTLGVTGNITGTLATAAQPNITSLGTLTALTGGTGDLNWDSGTLFVDSSANRVGIGTSSPSETLHVSSRSRIQNLYLGEVASNFDVVQATSSAGLYLTGGGSNGIYLDSSAKVGIGIANPADYYSDNLVVSSGTDGGITLAATATNLWNFLLFADGTAGDAAYRGQIAYNHATDQLAIASSDFMTFATGSSRSEKVRIDSSGRVGIGTSSPETYLHVKTTSPTISMTDTNSFSDTNDRFQIRANADVGQFQWYDDSASSTTTLMTLTPSGTMGFGMSPLGTNNGSAFFDGNVSSKDGFMTTASDLQMIAPSAGNTIFVRDNGNESMRINSGGVILIGTTAQSGISNTTTNHGISIGGGGQYVVNTNNDTNFIINRSNGTGTHIQFRYNGGNTGSISTNGSTVSYNTGSDYRLKENVTYEFNALDRVTQLKPARFNFIADETNTLVDGFLAHEVSSIVPEAIYGEKDGEEMQSIDQSKLVPLLTKAIQEQQTIIESLTARIAALES